MDFAGFDGGIAAVLQVANSILNQRELCWNYGETRAPMGFVVYREFDSSQAFEEALSELRDAIGTASATEVPCESFLPAETDPS